MHLTLVWYTLTMRAVFAFITLNVKKDEMIEFGDFVPLCIKCICISFGIKLVSKWRILFEFLQKCVFVF